MPTHLRPAAANHNHAAKAKPHRPQQTAASHPALHLRRPAFPTQSRPLRRAAFLIAPQNAIHTRRLPIYSRAVLRRAAPHQRLPPLSRNFSTPQPAAQTKCTTTNYLTVHNKPPHRTPRAFSDSPPFSSTARTYHPPHRLYPLLPIKKKACHQTRLPKTTRRNAAPATNSAPIQITTPTPIRLTYAKLMPASARPRSGVKKSHAKIPTPAGLPSEAASFVSRGFIASATSTIPNAPV